MDGCSCTRLGESCVGIVGEWRRAFSAGGPSFIASIGQSGLRKASKKWGDPVQNAGGMKDTGAQGGAAVTYFGSETLSGRGRAARAGE